LSIETSTNSDKIFQICCYI